MHPPVQIRNPNLSRKIRELAHLRGASITDTMGELVDRELEKVHRRTETQQAERRARVMATLARIWSRPKLGVMLTDDDFYGEDGLPRNSDR